MTSSSTGPGPPGSGKDTWIQQHLSGVPVVSLDAIRVSFGAAPTGNHCSAIQAAREQARALLRDNRGFAWNATNLSRFRRDRIQIGYAVCEGDVHRPSEKLLFQS